jgi:uncharacterized protein with PIN domain
MIIIIIVNESRNKKKLITNKVIKEKSKSKLTHCILCGTELEKGDKMKSKELKRKDDSIIYLYGCSNCSSGEKIRRCPICKQMIKEKGYLIGRMWLREKTSKNHLHIAGCDKCGKIKI